MQRWCTFFTLARKVPARVKSRTHDFRNLLANRDPRKIRGGGGGKWYCIRVVLETQQPKNGI